MKHWKILAVATLVAIAANVSRADDKKLKIPTGWTPHGKIGTTYKTGFSAPESEECGTACFIIGGPFKDDPDWNSDYASITKMVDVASLRKRELSIAFKYFQHGSLRDKEVWVRFFDAQGEIAKQHLRLTNLSSDFFVPASMNLLVPETAERMEIGFGLREGTFEFGGLKVHLVPDRYLALNGVKDELAERVDPLDLRVDQ